MSLIFYTFVGHDEKTDLIMRHTLLLLLVIVLQTAPRASASAALNPDNAGNITELEESGNRYFQENNPDSALICFSLIANNPALEGSTPAMRAKAFNICGHLYFLSHNFPAAYECFLKAISQDDDYETNKSNIYLSIIYSYLGDYPKDISYSRKAWRWCADHKDYTNFLTVHHNLLNSAFAHDQLISEVDIMNEFNTMTDIPSGIFYESVIATNDAMLDIVGKRYDSAVANFRRAYTTLLDTTAFISSRVCALENIAKTYALKNDFHSAVEYLQKANRIAEDNNLKEMKMANLKLMADYYAAGGDPRQAMSTKAEYLALKDSVLNLTSANTIYDMQATYDMNIVRDELFRANVRSDMLRKILWGASGVSAVLLALLLLLMRSNMTIKRINRNLYLKNNELMTLNVAPRPTPPETEESNASASAAKDGLSETMSNDILAAVETIMAEPSNFCSEGFSLDRLARLSGYNTKYISTVINQRIGKSFRQLLMEKRIREACIILKTEGLTHDISVEEIADRVGIKSRSNFSAIFKQITGMSPREFIKQAKEDNKSQKDNTLS